ncbi:MAG TPA: NAD(P)-dependent oxidoreductase [Anaerolineae bacterium]
MNSQDVRVGFIGLGRMGRPMCGHLLRAGFALTVFDAQAESIRALVKAGAQGANSPGEVGAQSDVILVMVADDAQVREVVAGANGLLQSARRGQVIAICSSAHPDTCRALAKLAAVQGVDVVDAPVARGQRGAEAGELTVFAGGERGAFEKCRAVFAPFAQNILYMGTSGAGQITKTCNNLMHWAEVVACHETLTLGARLGIPANVLRPALLAGSVDSRTLRELHLIGMVWPRKDLDIALELAEASHTPLPLMEEVRGLVTKISAHDLRALFQDVESAA